MAQMPKNIRQIGGREDRVKVYLEDYASTYLRRVQEEREEHGAAGMLTGSWPSEENDPACVFVSGALLVKQADLEGGRIRMTEEAWREAYETCGTYFSGQDLCGIFVCEGTCRRFRRQALFGAVRECFPDREQVLMYILTEEGEEIFYRITPRQEERLQGYYCYFERNEAMQDYMMDNLQQRHVEWEGRQSVGAIPSVSEGRDGQAVRGRSRGAEGQLGDPADRFRTRMRRSQERENQQSGLGIIGLCAAMAVVIAVSGMALMHREYGGLQVAQLLEMLDIDPDRLLPVAAQPEETAEHYVGSSTAGRDVVVEEIPGNVYPTEEPLETTVEESPVETGDGETNETAENSGGETVESDGSEAAEPDGNEAVETDGNETVGQEETSPPVTEAISQNVLSEGGMKYVVRAGDSLYAISRRFYGTEKMVSVIQQLNGLDNADLIKEGQTLLLP